MPNFCELNLINKHKMVRIFSRARERVYNVDFWMSSFLKSIGTLIMEDGEEVLPTTMQPVTLDDFESYLAPYVGNKVRTRT